MWNQMGHNIENDIWLSWSKLEYSGMHSAFGLSMTNDLYQVQ